jgi:hypoxanthine phosphoribosyltransferase
VANNAGNLRVMLAIHQGGKIYSRLLSLFLDINYPYTGIYYVMTIKRQFQNIL